MKAYTCDKLTSSVNDAKCSNAVVSEFMNEVTLQMISIFDFTVILVAKFWPNLICLVKQGKMGKQKQPSKRKEYAIQSR